MTSETEKLMRDRQALLKKLRKSRIRLPKGVSSTDILRQIRAEASERLCTKNMIR